MTIRVVVADDERLVRAGYRMIIDSEPDLAVVGEAADGVEAVDLVRRLRPDVVVWTSECHGWTGSPRPARWSGWCPRRPCSW
jgi:chemotaxis response regulator CheB